METTALPRRRGRPPRSGRTAADTREELLRAGMRLLTEQAYLSTGIDQILGEQGIPKGSFYHYFASKEAFGHAVIDRYGAYFARKLDRWLLDESAPPLQRLAHFMADAQAGMVRHDFRRGCLIGNLGQELGASHAAFRDHLEATLVDWQGRVARCLDAARAAGDLAAGADTARLARLFWIGWEGAVLRAKLVRASEPLDLFADHFLSTLPR